MTHKYLIEFPADSRINAAELEAKLESGLVPWSYYQLVEGLRLIPADDLGPIAFSYSDIADRNQIADMAKDVSAFLNFAGQWTDPRRFKALLPGVRVQRADGSYP